MPIGPILTAIGEAGNQFANAKLIAYQDRIQKMMDSLGLQQSEVGLSEAQERLKRLRAEPATPADALQQKFSAYEKALGRPLTASEKSVLLGLEPKQQAGPTVEDIEKHLGRKMSEAELERYYAIAPKEVPEKKVDIKSVGDVPYQITDEQGKTWSVHDPNLPDHLKKEVADYEAAAKKNETNKATLQARKDAEAIQRAITIGDAAELRKERGKVFDTTKRGISGHSFLKTIAQQVNLAEMSGGTGNKWGDLLIAEGFMQLMFGVDPKALRGSPQMTKFLLEKQGGWDDRLIAEMNNALNGGQMSQNAREQALEQATAQMASWDQQILQTGQLVDDAATKKLVDNYFKAVSQGEDQFVKSLGGKQH